MNKPVKSPAPIAPSMAEMQAMVAPFQARDYAACIAICEAYIARNRTHFFAYKLLGACHDHLGQYDLAIRAMQKAVQRAPDDAENHANLAKVLKDVGRFDEAMAHYQRALALAPDNLDTLYKYQFLLHYTQPDSPELLRQVAERVGGILSARAAAHRFDTWNPSSQAPLRLGFVSGDFRLHPVGFFLENVLRELAQWREGDGAAVEIILYHNHHGSDVVTERLRAIAHQFVEIHGLSDWAVAQRIHADGIAILFDLAGYSAQHRMGVFAHQPGPVQVAWLGYFATTGLPQMDYLLADATSLPAEFEHQFTERVLRLPHTRLCYGGQHLLGCPEVAPLPALANQHLTLGCFQNHSKITPEVMAVWAQILHALPTARLRVQNKQLGHATVQAEFIAAWQTLGISAERLSLHGLTGMDNYFAAHGEVDLILDTFPFTGGTTTCEALWMGVPTLSLSGATLIARQGHAPLHAAGLAGWVCHSIDEYQAKAIQIGQDWQNLVPLRHQLRELVRTSPLFDASQFARDFYALCAPLAHTQRSPA